MAPIITLIVLLAFLLWILWRLNLINVRIFLIVAGVSTAMALLSAYNKYSAEKNYVDLPPCPPGVEFMDTVPTTSQTGQIRITTGPRAKCLYQSEMDRELLKRLEEKD